MPEWALRAPLRPTAIVSTLATSGDLQSVDPLTTATLSGPSTAQTSVAVTYTITLNVAATQTYVVTPSCPGATVAPGSFDINGGDTTGQFTVTAPSDGTYSVDFTISPTLTRAGRPISLAAQTSPITLAFDEATPHQLSIKATATGTLSSDASAVAYYRVNGSGTWLGPVAIWRVRTSESSLFEGFAGWIVDLNAGTTYEVRVDVTQSGSTATGTPTTSATRTIPAENASPSGSGTAKTVTAGSASDLQSKLSGAVAGDVITIPNGTYSGNFSLTNKTGTVANPITIRGASRTGVIISGTSGTVLTMASCSNVVLENLTILGSQVNGGGGATSHGIDITQATGINPTFRHLTITGVDQGIKAWGTDVNGFLAYDCELLGNNTWPATIAEDDGGTHWNDTGIEMPGLGNAVWNCTFAGMGDTVKLTTGSGDTTRARACYFHHNWIKSGFDDGFEFDDSDRNNAVYNNIFENTVTLASVDTLGGPIGFFRNVCINQMRHPFKINAGFTNFICVNNTIVNTNKKPSGVASGNYSLQCAAGSNRRLYFVNNIVNYAGSGGLALIGGSFPNSTFDYNAWYPSGRTFQFGQYGAFQAHDVVTAANPFATAITLGADYTTEYAGHLDATLASGSNAKGSGLVVPGITDGYSGAAPDRGAIIAGQSYGTVGCSWNTVMPSWALNAAVGAFVELPNTGISSVAPAVPPPGYVNTDPDKIDTWNSIAFDQVRGRITAAAGGGHGDYAGNEVDSIDLLAELPRWVERRTCTTATTANVTHFADGRPNSRHSYYGIVADPDANRVMLLGGARWSDGQLIATVDAFDFATNDWLPAGTHPNIPFGTNQEAFPLARDPRNGNIYLFHSNGNAYKWTKATNTWSTDNLNSGSGSMREHAAAYDTTRNVIRILNGSLSMQEYNVTTRQFTTRTLTGTSIQAAGYNNTNGMTYVPAIDKYLVRAGTSGGGSVIQIDPSTNVSSTFATTGGSSVPSAAFGPWARWHYSPAHRGVFFLPRYSSNVWFLRVH